MKPKSIFLVVAVLLVVGTAACQVAAPTHAPLPTPTTPPPTAMPNMSKLTLVAPPGPLAVPMAYLVAYDKLDAVAEQVELVLWENPDQLVAIMANSQADFITLPTNSSANFYNKGFDIQLLDVTVWNILYTISRQADGRTLTDLKGDSLAIGFRGSIPDLMFQAVARAEGLDPVNDFRIQYTPNPQQAGQLLLAGRVQHAILSEPTATTVLLQQDAEDPLHRIMSFDVAWLTLGAEQRTPIAGTCVVGDRLGPEAIAAFQKQYRAAVLWTQQNREAAGALLADRFPALGFDAAPIAESLNNITWDWVPAADVRPQLEGFLTQLSQLDAAAIGGQLPDGGYYYAP